MDNDVPAARGAVITAAGLVKTYGVEATTVRALDGVHVEIGRGEFTAIMGPSGSGKSTLLHCLAGLESVTEGSIHLAGAELTRLSDKELTVLRRDKIGFIFQAFNLLPTLTARQNIVLPVELSGRAIDKAWFDAIVSALGIEGRLGHRPGMLSGGQQQRVACARALVTRPEVIFADEPTGNLDSAAGAGVLAFLRTSVDEFGQTIVMVTHDPLAAAHADRVLFLVDGRIVTDLLRPTADLLMDVLKKLERN